MDTKLGPDLLEVQQSAVEDEGADGLCDDGFGQVDLDGIPANDDLLADVIPGQPQAPQGAYAVPAAQGTNQLSQQPHRPCLGGHSPQHHLHHHAARVAGGAHQSQAMHQREEVDQRQRPGWVRGFLLAQQLQLMGAAAELEGGQKLQDEGVDHGPVHLLPEDHAGQRHKQHDRQHKRQRGAGVLHLGPGPQQRSHG